jgi:hypothetical protein
MQLSFYSRFKISGNIPHYPVSNIALFTDSIKQAFFHFLCDHPFSLQIIVVSSRAIGAELNTRTMHPSLTGIMGEFQNVNKKIIDIWTAKRANNFGTVLCTLARLSPRLDPYLNLLIFLTVLGLRKREIEVDYSTNQLPPAEYRP